MPGASIVTVVAACTLAHIHAIRQTTLPQLATYDGRFVLKNSGVEFTPLGADYIRLNGSQGTAPPLPVYHSTFSPRLANATLWNQQLSRMHSDGFNVVRVFVDVGALVVGTYLGLVYLLGCQGSNLCGAHRVGYWCPLVSFLLRRPFVEVVRQLADSSKFLASVC